MRERIALPVFKEMTRAVERLADPGWRGICWPALDRSDSVPDLVSQQGPCRRVRMRTTVSSGPDRVLIDTTSFSAGFMTNVYGVYGSSPTAFGHPGAGGAIAFADPEHGLGFAFIPSAMHPGALPGPRTQKFLAALSGVVVFLSAGAASPSDSHAVAARRRRSATACQASVSGGVSIMMASRLRRSTA